MADDEQFSLCWNNFNSNLSAGFHESLLRGDLVDVTLAAEGQLVKAHRLILSVCSPYFRKMFTQVPVNQHAFIFLKDVSHSALKDLIQFMYCGEVNVKQDALPAFISTAEALQIKGLTESGDSVPANQSPAKEEIQAAVPVVAAVPTSTPAITQRSKVQRNRAQSFKVDSEESGDDKVQIRASSSHHVSTQQQQSQATVAASTQKRTMQQRNVASHASKRTKLSVSASSEGMDTSDTVATQVQTVQIVKQIPAQVIEPEYIELPIESINPKNEPDYTDEPTEIETVDAETEQEHKLSEHDQGEADDDGNYVEDEAYGEMTITKYDETYLTEGEDNVKPGASGFVDSYTSDGGTGTEQSTQDTTSQRSVGDTNTAITETRMDLQKAVVKEEDHSTITADELLDHRQSPFQSLHVINCDPSAMKWSSSQTDATPTAGRSSVELGVTASQCRKRHSRGRKTIQAHGVTMLNFHELKKSDGKPAPRSRCVSCYNRNIQESERMPNPKSKWVTTFCEDCPGKPFLCILCFSRIHCNRAPMKEL
uniref:BTB domain-containing protein n=1 Tax=Anopheles dirus TaxID=7168 RepID=A0A182NKW9_9DIPT